MNFPATLRAAAADLRSILNDPRYDVDMGVFHSPHDGKCFVCLAGAYMAKTLGTDPTKLLEPYLMEREHYNVLWAISHVMSGDLYEAMAELDVDPDLPSSVNRVAFNRSNPEPFFEYIESVATMWENAEQ